MSENEPQEGTEAPDTSTDDAPREGSVDELPQWARDALAKANKEAASYRTKAQSNAKALQELDQFKKASMSDLEKAVAEATANVRTETLREAGGKLAAAEMRAAAAGRLTNEQLSGLLETMNLSAFVDDEGEVDRAKVAKFIERIAPVEQAPRNSGFPDLGQGARGTNGAGDMNALIRRGLGRS